LSDDGFTLSINAVDDSVASLIKAKKGTEYEYSVDVVKEDLPLHYDRMDMSNDIKWIDGGTILEDEENVSYIEFVKHMDPLTETSHTFPLFINSQEIANKGKCEIEEFGLDSYSSGIKVPPFFKAIEPLDIHLSFSFKMYGEGGVASSVASNSSSIHLFKVNEDKEYETLGYWPIYTKKYQITDVFFNNDVHLNKGEGLVLYIYTFGAFQGDKIYLLNSSGFNITFMSKGDSVKFDVIKPETILNRLLKSINGGNEGLNGFIVPSNERRLDNALILAGESARKIPNAKIYTSFSKFSQWMSAVYGYVYDINGKTVTFRPRKDYFADKKVKEVKNFTGYQMKVNSSLIYSQVNVGYEKQDYDSVNGKDEFRFTNIYNTGITMTDNKLELISPYRADAYGIEFLAQKIGEDTTDKSTDNSVFFVCANNGGDRYILDRTDTIQGVISPETMFNVMYSPTSMITANEAFLGGFISNLSYASSEGNSAVEINGKPENRDISLSGGLFSVNEIDIETSDIDLPEDMTGYVEFVHQGEVVRGYLLSIDYHYTKTKSAKLTLVEKK
jgi:hypothetical protein